MRKLTINYLINFYLLSLCVKLYVLSLYLSLLRWFRLSYSHPVSSSLLSFLSLLCLLSICQFVSIFSLSHYFFIVTATKRGWGVVPNQQEFIPETLLPAFPVLTLSLSTRKAIKWNTFHFNSNSAYIFLAPEVVTVKNPNPVGFMPLHEHGARR